MGATHKHSTDSVRITTRLTSEQIRESARIATQGIKSTSVGIAGVRTGYKVEVTASGPAAMEFIVKNAIGSKVMDFALSIQETDGTTSATSRIDGFRTEQQTFMMIPVAPKTMIGFHMYDAWARRLCEAIASQDPTASVVGYWQVRGR